MDKISVVAKMRMCNVVSWFMGLLFAVLLCGTVLVTDRTVPADFQGTQWMWLSAVIVVALPLWLTESIFNMRHAARVVSGVSGWVLIGFGAIEALHGLGQIAGIYPSGHSLFLLTGTFYNPGPYSGYLAAVLPIALHKMLDARGMDGNLSVVQYYSSLCVLMLICCVLPAGMSRAAWLASVVSCGYVFLRKYSGLARRFVLMHKFVVSGVLLVGMVVAFGAYSMKRDSADGRLLIWKITSLALFESPCGEENGRTFSAIYGDAQERYFTEGEYSASEAWVAGTPDFAFNEYLQIAVEHGVAAAVAFISLLVVLLVVAGRHKHLAGMGGCLISLMVFACFSYPLHIPSIVSVWILVVLTLFGEGLAMVKRVFVSWIVLLPVFMCVFIASLNIYGFYYERTQDIREWMPLRTLYHSGAFMAAAEGYNRLYKRMDWHNDFCFEYGRALYNVKHYGEAEEVLLDAMKVSGDPMILNLLGRNAQDRGEYVKAEEYLIRSTRRLPERIYPHYLLVKLYAMPGFYDKEKLAREAEYVLNAKPKVNSTAVREMKREVEEILTNMSVM